MAEETIKLKSVMINSGDESRVLSRRIATWFGYVTLFLTLLLIVGFLIIPVSIIMAKAFYADGQVSLEYFRLLFSNALQVEAMLNSLGIGFWSTVFCVALSYPLAVATGRFDFKGKAILSALLLVPMIMPPFVGAIGIQKLFAKMGSVNLFLLDIGWITEPIDWLGGEYKFWAVVILEVLHLYPIMYLNLSAAIANIDPSMEEAAAMFGAKRFRRYRDIVLPLSAPGFYAGAIIVFIWAFTDLGTPLLVGLHNCVPVQIFNMVTDANENPVGFALVFMVILATASLFGVSKYLSGRKKVEMMAKGHVHSAVTKIGFIPSLPIIFALTAVVTIALIPHLSVALTSVSDEWFFSVLPQSYTLDHYRMIWGTDLPATGIKNSLFLASASTLVDLVLGVMIAYVVVRKLIPFSGLLDALVMVPLALPGIVLAFGYVITYTDTVLDPLNNAFPLLIIAYAVRRLPFMVRSAASGLEQTHKSLEEASEILGASRFYTMRKVVMPLVMANLIAGSLLCFAYAMLDVSDSLILAMKDRFYPLTKAIYVLFLEQGTGDLVASSLGMVGMLILTMCIMMASLLLGKKMGELFRS